MIIKREAIAAALNAVTTNLTQYFLSAVQITPDHRVVASNGHILIIVRDTMPYADEDFPTDIAMTPITASVLLDAVSAERLLKGTPKRSKIPILGAVKVGRDGIASSVFATTTTDLDVPTVIRVPDNDHQFPNWERVIPTPKAVVSVSFSTGYLRALCKAADAIQGKGTVGNSQTLTFAIPTDKADVQAGEVVSGVGVTAAGRDGLELRGVIMPQ